MLDWFNFRLGETIGLIHALEKRYYQYKSSCVITLAQYIYFIYIWLASFVIGDFGGIYYAENRISFAFSERNQYTNELPIVKSLSYLREILA